MLPSSSAASSSGGGADGSAAARVLHFRRPHKLWDYFGAPAARSTQ